MVSPSLLFVSLSFGAIYIYVGLGVKPERKRARWLREEKDESIRIRRELVLSLLQSLYYISISSIQLIITWG